MSLKLSNHRLDLGFTCCLPWKTFSGNVRLAHATVTSEHPKPCISSKSSRTITPAKAMLWSSQNTAVKAKEAWRKKCRGVPIVVQQKWIQLVSTKMWVRSLTSLSGLRIWCCCELWCRLQTQFRSGVAVAVAVAVAGSCSSDLTPSLRTSMCHRECGPKKEKKKKKKKR